jgi:TetR/AcrR family transcriptional regulator, cholesterol catabolism regulator
MANAGTRSSNNRREEVYTAAANLFYDKGYDAASVQDIANAVGLLKSSVYHYMDSKEDLLFNLIKASHDDLLVILDDVLSSREGPLQQLRQLTRRHSVYVAENPVVTGLFLNHFRALTGERREYIVRERHRYEEGWVSIIKAGQSVGEIRGELNPKITAYGYLGLANGIHQWFRPGAPLSANQVGEQYADLVCRGVASNPTQIGPRT